MEGQTVRKMPMGQTFGRILGHGVDHIDYQQLLARLDQGEDYVYACDELGDKDYEYAEAELEKGHVLTARQFFLNATALYRVGQYAIVPDNDEKKKLYRKLIDSYSRAATLFDPPIEKVEVPYNDYKMAGWLWLPDNDRNDYPVVIIIGGADGWREEFHNKAARLIERGIGALLIDGPGQGETRIFNHGYLELEVEKPLDAIVEYLYNDPRVGDQIGVWGNSFGGYLVSRLASYSEHLSACAFQGGSYYPKEILNLLPPFIHVFVALYGKDEAYIENEILDKMTLEGLAEKITCPLLIVHGIADPVFSYKGVQRIYDEAASKDKTIKLYEDGDHCVDNHSTEAMLLIADWFADRFTK